MYMQIWTIHFTLIVCGKTIITTKLFNYSLLMKKDIWAVIIFILLYVAINIGFVRATTHRSASIAEQLSFMQTRPQIAQLFFLFIVQELLLLGIFALVFRRWKGRESIVTFFRERFQWKGWILAIKRSVGGVLVYMVFSAFLLGILNYLGITIPGLYGEQMVMTMLQWISLDVRYDYVLLILLAVVIGPLVEELLFRWFVTDTLAKHLGWSGIIIASILFATAHMERGVVLNLTILALFLSYIYRKTGSMRYSLLFHMGINGLAVVALILTKFYPELW